MLISFSASNFRSINEKQVIDMEVATKYHEEKPNSKFKNNLFATKDETVPKLLKSSAIYGANASGKSNLIRAAFAFNHVFMRFDKRSRGDNIEAYDPFLLDEKSKNKPTEFSIDFIAEGKRYLYSFAYDGKQIHRECLEAYFDGKKELIFELLYDKKVGLKENFSSHFEGKKDAALDIFKNTKNNLFLPLNVNEDGNKFLNPVYDWIEEKLLIESDHDNYRRTLHWIQKDQSNKKKALKVLRSIDVGIADFEIETIERELPTRWAEDKSIPERVKEKMKNTLTARFITTNGHSLNERYLSLGTRAALSLCSVIFPVLSNGGVLFFDELDQSLHPDVLIYFVKMFHNPKINKGNGQLIFTAHNDILLEKEFNVFRRDQVWFVSKDEENHASYLYSLAEFKASEEKKGTKKRDNIVELYRNGYYGARPYLREFGE